MDGPKTSGNYQQEEEEVRWTISIGAERGYEALYISFCTPVTLTALFCNTKLKGDGPLITANRGAPAQDRRDGDESRSRLYLKQALSDKRRSSTARARSAVPS